MVKTVSPLKLAFALVFTPNCEKSGVPEWLEQLCGYGLFQYTFHDGSEAVNTTTSSIGRHQKTRAHTDARNC